MPIVSYPARDTRQGGLFRRGNGTGSPDNGQKSLTSRQMFHSTTFYPEFQTQFRFTTSFPRGLSDLWAGSPLPHSDSPAEPARIVPSGPVGALSHFSVEGREGTWARFG